MLPTRALRLSIGELAADNLPLAAVAATNDVRLIIADFTPDENLTFADLTFADFDGSTELSAALGDQQTGEDPLTGDQLITMIEPAGGWRWTVTGVTNLPQTVYGYALIDTAAGTDLLGVAKLPTPIPLTAVGQEINIGTVAFRLNQQLAS